MRSTIYALILIALSACGSEPETATTAPDSSTEAGGTPALASDPFPLETCPVSGEQLGSMGDPIVLAQPGREVKLCCEGCVKSYEDGPEEFNAEIDAAIAEAQKASYPLETCLISGEVIGESDAMVPVDHVVGNRLYRLCCASCVKALEKDLPKYRAEVIAAATK